MAGERFNREAGKPWLAEAPRPDATLEQDVDAAELLTRLEVQAAESGRLSGRVQTLERALKTERGARRSLTDTIRRERRAAKALHERAEHDRAVHAAAAEELERLRQAVTVSEEQLHMTWTRLMHAEKELVWRQRRLWRKLLRRPPGT